ncbi:MAG: DsbA family protein [Acidimicrobiales bacterium]
MTTTAPPSDPGYDIEFFWDPVCPFAWITSRWVEKVAAQTDYKVDWRFISLRILNKDKDYATEFPPEYEHGHTAGLRMLRVAAAIRADLGRDPMAALVTAYGESYWDKPKGSGMRSHLSTTEHAEEVLAAAGLPTDYAKALDDTSWDAMLEDETELALARTGRDVGTPIITFRPPDGLSFFGPVISRVPSDEDAVRLWDAVTTLAGFPGFAEMKRSLREVPQLNILGGTSDAPQQEDWQGGHRRGHLASDRDR